MTQHDTFTQTEARTRLSSLASVAKRHYGYPMNYRVEVGRRHYPVAFDYMPGREELIVAEEGDDLRDFVLARLIEPEHEPDVCRHGAVVHLYISSTGDWGQLESVVTGWMGTPDQSPVLLRTDGTYIANDVESQA